MREHVILNWDLLGITYTQLKRGNISIDFETDGQPGEMIIMLM